MSPTVRTVRTVESELARVKSLMSRLGPAYCVREHGDFLYTVSPAGQVKSGDKPIDLTISALIHGVEVAGLAVIADFLSLVTSGRVKLDLSLGLTLGNLPAAFAGKRFVERDLNRSFGRSESQIAEDRRARELEVIFGQSRYLLDIHQVKLTCDRPFWIFPYTPGGYQFARAVAGDVALITHWGKGFSADGQCSDEWVNRQGGIGVTVELGQNGFDPAQISNGVDICLRAVAAASGRQSELTPRGPLAPIFTWAEIVPYPETGQPVLDEGWHNFRWADQGCRLGSFNGREIQSPASGYVLFPKYPDKNPDGTYPDKKPAAELMRIMREIQESDLPVTKQA